MNTEQWVADKLKTEIAAIIRTMRTAADSQREYSIGALSALLWVQGAGEVARYTAFTQACETWDKVRGEAEEMRGAV